MSCGTHNETSIILTQLPETRIWLPFVHSSAGLKILAGLFRSAFLDVEQGAHREQSNEQSAQIYCEHSCSAEDEAFHQGHAINVFKPSIAIKAEEI